MLPILYVIQHSTTFIPGVLALWWVGLEAKHGGRCHRVPGWCMIHKLLNQWWTCFCHALKSLECMGITTQNSRTAEIEGHSGYTVLKSCDTMNLKSSWMWVSNLFIRDSLCCSTFNPCCAARMHHVMDASEITISEMVSNMATGEGECYCTATEVLCAVKWHRLSA